MASVRKRGNSYQVTVSNGRRADGTQIIETDTYTPEPGMTKRQIEKALEAFVVDFERAVKSGQNIKGKKMTLKELSELYIADTEPKDGIDDGSLSLTTWVLYQGILKNRIIPKLGHVRIGDIIQKTINDYAKELRKDGSRLDGKKGGLSEATITKDRNLISSMLNYAVGEGLIDINPLLYAGKQQRGKKIKKEYAVEYFTLEQTRWFLWALDNPIEVKRAAHYRTNRYGTKYLVPEYTQTWELSLMWKAYFYLNLFIGDRKGDAGTPVYPLPQIQDHCLDIQRECCKG